MPKYKLVLEVNDRIVKSFKYYEAPRTYEIKQAVHDWIRETHQGTADALFEVYWELLEDGDMIDNGREVAEFNTDPNS